MLHLPSIVSQVQLVHEKPGDDGGALGRGMQQVGRHQPGAGREPAGHRAIAAHGVIGVKESDMGLGGCLALNGDDLGNGIHGLDLVQSAAFPPIHGAHDQNRRAWSVVVNALNRQTQLRRVLLVNKGAKAAFVGAVVDDNQRGRGTNQLLLPQRGLQYARQD